MIYDFQIIIYFHFYFIFISVIHPLFGEEYWVLDNKTYSNKHGRRAVDIEIIDYLRLEIGKDIFKKLVHIGSINSKIE